MPVLIFGGIEDVDLFLPLATKLRDDGSEVRCYLDDDSYELRNIGCKIAVGRLDDETNLEGALTNVHTFIPFLRDPVRVADGNAAEEVLEIARSVVGGAEGARIPQTIVPLPAFDEVDGEVPKAYAAAKEEFLNRVSPLCVIRTGFVWGPERPFTGMIPAIPGDEIDRGTSVTRVEDLASVLASADDREQIEGIWDFASAPVPLQELKAAGSGQATLQPPPWLLGLLRHGFVVGSSAAEELGVPANGP
jgi:hypothetical protein